jgi:hypothetical protein
MLESGGGGKNGCPVGAMICLSLKAVKAVARLLVLNEVFWCLVKIAYLSIFSINREEENNLELYKCCQHIMCKSQYYTENKHGCKI